MESLIASPELQSQSSLANSRGHCRSLPPSKTRVRVPVGVNDTARQKSELTETDFEQLFNFLKTCGKSVFISGPIPTLGHGVGRLSRILSLNSQSACSVHCLGFFDNFDLFWGRSSFFTNDVRHSHLNFKTHVRQIVESGYFLLRNISIIESVVSLPDLEKRMHAFVPSLVTS